MSKLNWHSLRSWSGSQQLAFEEFCCQLAAHESAPPVASFIRKGTPDGGVECFWVLSNGDEWAWQAKFFLESPASGEWSQIDASVKKALEKHHRLTRYTICLPIDRSDARLPETKSFLEKWGDRVAKWKGWASAAQIDVEFEFWGEHELFVRLSRDEHRGRHFFWFNSELFTTSWFRDRVEESISNAGPRYTAELNVELPIAAVFDGLGRTQGFRDRFLRRRGDIGRTLSDATRDPKKEIPGKAFAYLKETSARLRGTLDIVEPDSVVRIDFARISQEATETNGNAWSYQEALSSIISTETDKQQSESGKISAGAKRAAIFSELLQSQILAGVPHAQWVFSIPKMLRPYFLHHRELLLKRIPLGNPGITNLDSSGGSTETLPTRSPSDKTRKVTTCRLIRGAPPTRRRCRARRTWFR